MNSFENKTPGHIKKIKLGGIEVDNVSFKEVLSAIDQWIRSDTKHYIVTPNVNHVVIGQRDALFREIYSKASLRIADGVPILWASRLLKMPIQEKISGSDLVVKLCDIAAIKGYRIFFLGGLPGAAELAKQKLLRVHPEIQIVGIYCPPLNFEVEETENNLILSMINKSEPDILMVALGAPKQEKWIYKNLANYNAKVSLGIGASLDFLSGKIKRAPIFFQIIGLEWFWRLVHEPKRLFKRYFFDGLRFSLIIVQEISGILWGKLKIRLKNTY